LDGERLGGGFPDELFGGSGGLYRVDREVVDERLSVLADQVGGRRELVYRVRVGVWEFLPLSEAEVWAADLAVLAAAVFGPEFGVDDLVALSRLVYGLDMTPVVSWSRLEWHVRAACWWSW